MRANLLFHYPGNNFPKNSFSMVVQCCETAYLPICGKHKLLLFLNPAAGVSFLIVKKLIKVIPQKLNLPMNFFETFPESSLLSTVSKKTKMIGQHSRLRDMMGQSYPIYACTSAYHAHYLSVHVTFCGGSKHTLFK